MVLAWPAQPEALVRFELAPERSGGTDLTWTLLVAELPDRSRLVHYRKRINELVHRDLRYSYGSRTGAVRCGAAGPRSRPVRSADRPSGAQAAAGGRSSTRTTITSIWQPEPTAPLPGTSAK